MCLPSGSDTTVADGARGKKKQDAAATQEGVRICDVTGQMMARGIWQFNFQPQDAIEEEDRQRIQQIRIDTAETVVKRDQALTELRGLIANPIRTSLKAAKLSDDLPGAPRISRNDASDF